MCILCVWVKLLDLYLVEFCENGVKVMIWDLICRCCGLDFFVVYCVVELCDWLDYDFEVQGCLIYFMWYDVQIDCYVLISWDVVF